MKNSQTVARSLLLFALGLTLSLTIGCGKSDADADADAATADDSADVPGVLNIYSSRHYDSDDDVYAMFTEATGIEVNLIEGNADELLARLKREGDLSPADIFITVDAARLQKGLDSDIFQPVSSELLEERVPVGLRHPDGLWFALSKRMRCIFVRADAPEGEVTTYAELADPKLQGELLIRSSSNVYNQSMVAWLIDRIGPEQTEAWAKGVVNNLARVPQGGDTDQLRALAAGEGKVAVANHYYFANMLNDNRPGDAELAKRIRMVFPNQNDGGAMVNICGAGVLKNAPNQDNAITFLEFMTTVQAQEQWVAESFEYPIVVGAKPASIVQSFGQFEADPLDIKVLGSNNRAAVQTMDRASWR